MRTDVSGWATRLTDEDIERYTRSGAWRGETLADRALSQLARAPDSAVAVEGGRSVTCTQVMDHARWLVGAFDALGLKAGEVISFQLPNWVETLALNIAASVCRSAPRRRT